MVVLVLVLVAAVLLVIAPTVIRIEIFCRAWYPTYLSAVPPESIAQRVQGCTHHCSNRST